MIISFIQYIELYWHKNDDVYFSAVSQKLNIDKDASERRRSLTIWFKSGVSAQTHIGLLKARGVFPREVAVVAVCVAVITSLMEARWWILELHVKLRDVGQTHRGLQPGAFLKRSPLLRANCCVALVLTVTVTRVQFKEYSTATVASLSKLIPAKRAISYIYYLRAVTNGVARITVQPITRWTAKKIFEVW